MRPYVLLLSILLLLVMACTRPQPTVTPTIPPAVTPTTAPSSTPTAIPATVLTPTFTPAIAASPIPTSTPSPTPSPLAPVFEQVLARVAAIRGLEPLEPVMPKFMTREQLADNLNEDLEESRDDITNSQALLKIMGLIPQDADLYQMLLSLYAEQVVGFYNTDTRELYVITGMEKLTPMDELTLAHEYVHALQQQHFDIHALGEAVKDDSEADSALSALIEGDASTVQIEYMYAHLTSRQRQEVLDASSGGSPIFDASPYVLQESLLFPYSQGAYLINTLLLAGKWDAVNRAYGNPPVSTEQVLHPEKYLKGEIPMAVSLLDVAAALGQGWQMTYEDVMGEFLLRTYLETRIGSDQASRAAAGWGGDRFNLLTGPDGQQALIALLKWDTQRDAQEFWDAMRFSLKPSEGGFLSLNGDQVLWVVSQSQAVREQIVSLFAGF